MTALRLTVLGANDSWVRSLFEAMPEHVAVDHVSVYSPPEFVREHGTRLWRARRWAEGAPGHARRFIIVPGVRRYPSASTRVIRGVLRRRAAKIGAPDALICTNPYLAPVAPDVDAKLRVYYPSDAFEYYDWDAERTRALQARAIEQADLTVANARQLQQDFGALASQPVHHLPTAVSRAFVDVLSSHVPPPPPDIAAVPRKIVGCIGTMNHTYDWPLIDRLTGAFPETSFVFVGPIVPMRETDVGRIHRSLERPNVYWLGSKAHAELPSYLAQFDVCLNPLAVTPHNDRRCPLRLYDYLAGDRPVLTTAIREAAEFEPHVITVAGADEAIEQLRRILDDEVVVDVAARREWILENTCERRAEGLLAIIASVAAGAKG